MSTVEIHMHFSRIQHNWRTHTHTHTHTQTDRHTGRHIHTLSSTGTLWGIIRLNWNVTENISMATQLPANHKWFAKLKLRPATDGGMARGAVAPHAGGYGQAGRCLRAAGHRSSQAARPDPARTLWNGSSCVVNTLGALRGSSV